jgi:glutaconyl-CoA/methylmalonyl-CoA decarboxylase subunit gamma
MKKLRVTVDGKAYEVTVEMTDEPAVVTQSPAAPAAPVASAPAPVATNVAAPVAAAPAAATAGAVRSPLAGKVVSIDVQVGATVAAGAQLATIEAMKMNTFVFAEQAGTVKSITAKAGEAVEEGGTLLVIG